MFTEDGKPVLLVFGNLEHKLYQVEVIHLGPYVGRYGKVEILEVQ